MINRSYIPYFLYIIGTFLCVNSLYAQPMLEGPAIPDIMVDVNFSDSLDVIQLQSHEYERINEIDFVSIRYVKRDEEVLNKSVVLL